MLSNRCGQRLTRGWDDLSWRDNFRVTNEGLLCNGITDHPVGSIPKSPVSHMVEEHLEKDVVMAQALHRDILNHAAAARWLEANEIPGAHERTIVSALRRWEPTQRWQQNSGDFEALRGTDVSVTAGCAVFDVTRSVATQQRLIKTRQRIHPGAPLHALQGQQKTRVVVPKDAEQETQVALGFKNIQQEFHDAGLIGFYRHDEDGGLRLPLSTAIGLHAFGSAGVRILGSFGFEDECYVIVPQEHVQMAYRLAVTIAGSEAE